MEVCWRHRWGEGEGGEKNKREKKNETGKGAPSLWTNCRAGGWQHMSMPRKMINVGLSHNCHRHSSAGLRKRQPTKHTQRCPKDASR